MYWACTKCSSFGANERIAQVFTVQTNTEEEMNTHLGKIKKAIISNPYFHICAHLDFCLPKSLINKIPFFFGGSWISIATLRSVSSSCLLHRLTCRAAWFRIDLSFGNDWLIKTQPATTPLSALWVWMLGELFTLFLPRLHLISYFFMIKSYRLLSRWE